MEQYLHNVDIDDVPEMKEYVDKLIQRAADWQVADLWMLSFITSYFLCRLEVCPGYATDVNECEGGLLLCCDVSFYVMRTTSVLEDM